jgi:alkyl sulfatase BDS1-like metallo-beta-lactamase superfamily hydrolase
MMSDLPFDDQTDFENAERGRIDALDPCVVRAADGRVVWDLTAYSYLDADCPDTVNPSLWRQAQLCAKHGLFQVTDGIYQVRGMDISNMTIIEGDTGVIVIDPLISAETAAASIALYRKNRGDRPVTGVIYTHSHADHFGGVNGVLTGGAGRGCHPHRAGRNDRRGADRLPDHAGHRGAVGDELLLPGSKGAVHGRERHP